MNEIDREIGLVLLKRLWQRDLIDQELYRSASRSRFTRALRPSSRSQ